MGLVGLGNIGSTPYNMGGVSAMANMLNGLGPMNLANMFTSGAAGGGGGVATCTTPATAPTPGNQTNTSPGIGAGFNAAQFMQQSKKFPFAENFLACIVFIL